MSTRYNTNRSKARIVTGTFCARVEGVSDGGSACHVDSSTRIGRGDEASAESPSPAFSTPAIKLHADGCCLRNEVGGWAYLLEAADGGRIVEGSGGLWRTTNNRAELLAVIRGLESLTFSATVCVVTDSQYVVAGINERLPIWKVQGWRGGSQKHRRPLTNADLWRRLDIVLAKHRVVCQHVHGHSGHPQNEECDRFARGGGSVFRPDMNVRNHKRSAT